MRQSGEKEDTGMRCSVPLTAGHWFFPQITGSNVAAMIIFMFCKVESPLLNHQCVLLIKLNSLLNKQPFWRGCQKLPSLQGQNMEHTGSMASSGNASVQEVSCHRVCGFLHLQGARGLCFWWKLSCYNKMGVRRRGPGASSVRLLISRCLVWAMGD